MRLANDIAKRIKISRSIAGLKQRELADKVGVSLITIARWENPESGRSPNSAMITKLAEVLNTSAGYLMGLEDIEKQDEESETELPYYINDDAREMAQFMFENPEYKVLFDASRKISKEDIETVKAIMDRFKRPDND